MDDRCKFTTPEGQCAWRDGHDGSHSVRASGTSGVRDTSVVLKVPNCLEIGRNLRYCAGAAEAHARIIELESKLQACELERDALRREVERLEPTMCGKYLEDNLCIRPKSHEGECRWFPF